MLGKRLFHKLLIQGLSLFPPDQVLRGLFGLDRWLYYLQGQAAIAYGNGVHTKHRHTRYHDFFVGRILPGERVLDIGSGIGVVARDIAERANACVVGVDINRQHVAQAARYHSHSNVEYIVGDVSTGCLVGRFDVIVLSNVLEHLERRPEFLRQLVQRMMPFRILIRVPLYERDWRVPLKRELGIDWRLDPTHQVEYTLESFAEEVRMADLRIAYQEVRWGEIWAEAVPSCSADSPIVEGSR